MDWKSHFMADAYSLCGFGTESEWKELKQEMDMVFEQYIQGKINGIVDNIKTDIYYITNFTLKTPPWRKPCGKRAEELERKLQNLLTNERSLFCHVSSYDVGIHAFCIVTYRYKSDSGEMIQGYIYYDPWLKYKNSLEGYID